MWSVTASPGTWNVVSAEWVCAIVFCFLLPGRIQGRTAVLKDSLLWRNKLLFTSRTWLQCILRSVCTDGESTVARLSISALKRVIWWDNKQFCVWHDFWSQECTMTSASPLIPCSLLLFALTKRSTKRIVTGGQQARRNRRGDLRCLQGISYTNKDDWKTRGTDEITWHA